MTITAPMTFAIVRITVIQQVSVSSSDEFLKDHIQRRTDAGIL